MTISTIVAWKCGQTVPSSHAPTNLPATVSGGGRMNGGKLPTTTTAFQTRTKMAWETGKAYWLGVDPAGEQHADLNKGKEPMEVIVVEMRK